MLGRIEYQNPTNGEGRHKAIIAYLGVINAPNTAAAFREEANVSETFDDATRKKYEGLLEKKWTSVVRLQKKVHDVQDQLGTRCSYLLRYSNLSSAIRAYRANLTRLHRPPSCERTKIPLPGYHERPHGIPSNPTAHR